MKTERELMYAFNEIESRYYDSRYTTHDEYTRGYEEGQRDLIRWVLGYDD